MVAAPGGFPIGLVTDSTAQLNAADREAVEVSLGGLFAEVPLSVLVDGVGFADAEISGAELCAAMSAGAEVSTSMATAERFRSAYDRLHAQGAAAVLAVTMSGALSGTKDAAVSAAADRPLPIEVVDSRTTSAGLAGAVRVAAAGIGRGLDISTVAGAVADWCAAETMTAFAPATLEHLRRGGRIGAAASLLGRALQIVPVLGLRGGTVVPLARVRTRAKALQRIVALGVGAAEQLGVESVEAVIQTADGDLVAPEVESVVTALAGQGITTVRRELSSVITAHVGPGAVGLTVQTVP